MTFEEAAPVEVEVVPEIDDALPVDDVEPDFTIPPENEIVTNPKVMLSTEIAALTGKSHHHVMRDIREINQKLTSSNLSWSVKSTEYKAGNGQMQPCYELDQTASMVLVTGYNPVCALKMMKCWNSESEPEVVEDEPVVESESEPEVVEDEPVVEEPAPEVFEIEIYAKPIGSDEVNTVNARELHGKLKVKTRFNDWIVNRIEKYKFVESQEFITLTENLVSGGKQTNYFISLDMAKQLSMVENNEQGTIARRYFIECEKIAKGEIPKVEPKPESSLIENMKAASAVIDVTMTMLNRLGIEGNQATLGANKVAAQATGFNILEMIGASAIVSPVNERYYNATHLAKELGFKSPNEFNSHLEELGYQVKEITGKVRGGNDKWHWIPTEKGKPFSVMLDTEKAHSTGTVQHLRWYASIIKEIEIK